MAKIPFHMTTGRPPTPPPPCINPQSFSSLESELESLLISTPSEPEFVLEGQWGKGRTHLFIMSDSGLPIYTRYGDEHEIATYFGLISATIGLISSIGQGLSSSTSDLVHFSPHFINAGSTNLAFFYHQSLVYVLSCNNVPVPLMRRQLELVHGLVATLLTGSRIKMEQKKLVNYIAGSKILFENLMNFLSNSIAPFLNSFEIFLLPSDLKQSLIKCTPPNIHSNILFHLFLTNSQVIHYSCSKKLNELHSNDITLLLNLCSSTSAPYKRGANIWLPFCFSHTSQLSSSWVYLLVECVVEDPHVVLVVGCLRAGDISVANEYSERVKSGLNPILNPIGPHLKRPNVEQLGIFRLQHFICFRNQSNFLSVAEYSGIFLIEKFKRELLQLYFSLHSEFIQSNSKILIKRGSTLGVLVGLISNLFTVYALMDPFSTADEILIGCNSLLSWYSGKLEKSGSELVHHW
ncbi:hypothetical protein RCL1_004888 [Eukaryota sp. TZLM3-RCL]